MADAYISTTTLSNDVLDVMNKRAEFAFSPKMIFAQVAESKVHENGADADPGSPVKFTIYDLMNPTTDTLSETSDPDAVAITDTIKSVTLLEKGNVTVSTEKLANLDTVGKVRESTVPTLVGQNMGESTDLYARSIFDTQVGTAYVTYVGQTAKSSIASTNIMTAAVVRQARTKLEKENVPVDPRFGSYIAIMHPEVLYDLRKETGDAAWISVAKYADPQAALKGEIGMFDNFRFISTTNVKHEPDAGAAAQAATTASTGNSAGSTTLDVTDASGIVAGDEISITHAASGDTYTYEVQSVSTNELTIGVAYNKNGTVYRTKTAGLVEAAVAGDVVKEGVNVYTSYFIGHQALAYAYARRPNMVVSGPFDKLQRLLNVGWYALHAYGELRPESLHKVFSASSIANNS